jgi:LAGLIDADG DNA endonuclease family
VAEVTCQQCGRVFAISLYRFNRGECKYCSHKCAGVVLSAGYRARRVSKDCLVCGAKFLVKQSKGVKAKFCSWACKSAYQQGKPINLAISRPISSSFLRKLDGLLLGDGNYAYAKTRPGSNSYYRQPSKSFDWLQELRDTFTCEGYSAEIYPYTVQDRHYGYLQSCASPELTEQRHRWYPMGVKEIPPDLELTPTTLRQWYLGDGTMRHRGAFAAFCTEGFSRGSMDLLLAKLISVLGKSSARLANRRKRWNIELTRPGTAKLLSLIQRDIPLSLAHRFIFRPLGQ